MSSRQLVAQNTASEAIFPYCNYTYDDCEDKLGTLPPGTLVLVEYPDYPYFPAYVMSRTEARRQRNGELPRKIHDLENGVTAGCCVRFFATNGADVLSPTNVEPLVVNDKSYMEWIWRSSQGQQRLKEKPEFSEPMHRLWARAFDDALAYASRNNRSYTKMVVEEQLLNQGRPYRRVGFLKPGTFVWALLTTHPIWPAYVQKEAGSPKVSSGKLTSEDEETEPLIFIGDDVPDRAAMYVSTDKMMAFTADFHWIEHMRVRSILLRKERGFKEVAKKDWDLWHRACERAFALAGVVEPPSDSPCDS